jgi:hypothetical protein
VVALGSTACLPDVVFECTADAECSRGVDGRCDAGNCTYADDSCESRRRYSAFADAAVAGVCVEALGTSGVGGTVAEGGSASSGATPMDWWDCAWGHRARVAFAGDPGPALADFTVLVAIDHAALPGSFAADGVDLRFVDDDGQSVLDHEIEHFDATGTTLAWVRVPDLRTGVDDGILLYWDNPAATAPTSGTAWDEHHVGVWHLGDDANDATPTGAHGSDDSAGPTAGKIGDARRFTLDAEMPTSINVGSASAIDDVFAAGGTVLAWVRVDALPVGEVARVAGKTQTDPGHTGWKLFAVDEPTEPSATRMTFGFHRDAEFNPAMWQGPSDALAIDDEWRLLGATFCDDPTTCSVSCEDDCTGDCTPSEDPRPRLFLDGAPVLTIVAREPGFPARSDAADQMIVGRGPSSGEAFAGAIDELRVARTVRCDSWMRAEHLSMTGALAQVGAAQTSSCAE